MNIEQLNTLLNKHFKSIDRIILSRQNPITGLLPASTAVNAHGDYTDAWVRDNVYSILCVWGLSLSFKRYSPSDHKTHLLTQSTVKLMRGLLNAMMRQSDKIETFKHTLDPKDALHAKYSTTTGETVVGDDEWGHLQLDATSIFLLMLSQMIASGLKIVYTMDEVNFIQNLVHYISKTYCTPDYGIWERGNKINHGTPEINCSSVGMAKAALETMNGFNLFGNVATTEAVIHVMPNDIARSRFTLHGLLPRESNSKETDAALLSIIGYPAYAIEDKELVDKTKEKILKKLGGNYGCKRFLRDGHQSVIEDESRLHYEPSELREFEHIESEWPLFFTYLLLDALVRGDSEEIKKYKEKLEPLFVEQNGEHLLPELYIVPKELIEAEKENPGSQKRIPNENLPLVWAQSLYMLSDMMIDGILRPADIDPMNRRERIGHIRSTTPLVSIIAEDKEIKQTLLNYGIKAETLDDVSPLRVMYSDELSKVHTMLGRNDKLGLKGRPFIETRTISTSYLHKLAGEDIIFLPYYFNPKGFYFSYDNRLLAEHFRSSIKFLAHHWDQPGQPLISFFVRSDMLIEKDKDIIIELLNEIQTGICDDITIKHGLLNQLRNTAATESINYLHNLELHDLTTESRSFKYTPSNNETGYTLEANKLQKLENTSTEELTSMVIENKNRLKSAIILKILYEREGEDFKISMGSMELPLLDIVQIHYKYATGYHDWAVVRRLADLTGKYDDKLEDALLDIVIRQKQLAVGRAYNEDAIFSQPSDSGSIIKKIAKYSGSNSAENVLSQEMILHLGHLVRTEPELFENTLTLRTWYYLQLLVSQISKDENLSMGQAYEYLLSLSPQEIYTSLRSIIKSFNQKVEQLNEQEGITALGIDDIKDLSMEPISSELPNSDNWLEWRKEAGMLGHTSSKFNKNVWYILQQCKGLVIGDKYNINSRIGNEITMESTPEERSFEVIVDKMLQRIPAPEYRQLNIEILESLSRLFKQNPHIKVQDDLIMDVLIGHAVRIAWCEGKDCDNYNEAKSKAWENFYELSPNKLDKIFIEAFKHLLIKQENEEEI